MNAAVVQIALPSVHMAGGDAHYPAHFELSQHGLALFLTRDAEFPVLDINATADQLDAVVQQLQTALVSMRSAR